MLTLVVIICLGALLFGFALLRSAALADRQSEVQLDALRRPEADQQLQLTVTVKASPPAPSLSAWRTPTRVSLKATSPSRVRDVGLPPL